MAAYAAEGVVVRLRGDSSAQHEVVLHLRIAHVWDGGGRQLLRLREPVFAIDEGGAMAFSMSESATHVVAGARIRVEWDETVSGVGRALHVETLEPLGESWPG